MSKGEAKAAIAAAKEIAGRVPDLKRRQVEAKKELREYGRRMAILKTQEARQLLKDRFDYPIFLYDAERVGITATGEEDTCELFQSETLDLPDGMKPEDTALVQYRRFQHDPVAFIHEATGREGR